ncbi:MAG: hypothetical protein IKZ09_12820, partial [Clostridia bacterium]|nr:hypothetical protein [Clostridia bacterium]
MKYNTKSAISVCLLAAALLSAAMVSCGSASETDVVTEAADNTNDTAVVTEAAEETRVMHGLEVDTLDFGGEELNMSYFNWQGYKFYFFA